MRLGKSIGVGKINCMIGWIDVWYQHTLSWWSISKFPPKKGQDKPTHRSLSAELQGSRRSSPSISRASHGGALMQLTKGDADDARIHRFIWASPRNCVICRLQWRGIVVFFLAFCEGFSIPFPKSRSGCSANSSRCGLAGRLLRQSLTDQWFP